MVQDQLQQVINRNKYTTWLCKQLNETDSLLIKYQQKMDVLQKHVRLNFFVGNLINHEYIFLPGILHRFRLTIYHTLSTTTLVERREKANHR